MRWFLGCATLLLLAAGCGSTLAGTPASDGGTTSAAAPPDVILGAPPIRAVDRPADFVPDFTADAADGNPITRYCIYATSGGAPGAPPTTTTAEQCTTIPEDKAYEQRVLDALRPADGTEPRIFAESFRSTAAGKSRSRPGAMHTGQLCLDTNDLDRNSPAVPRFGPCLPELGCDRLCLQELPNGSKGEVLVAVVPSSADLVTLTVGHERRAYPLTGPLVRDCPAGRSPSTLATASIGRSRSRPTAWSSHTPRRTRTTSRSRSAAPGSGRARTPPRKRSWRAPTTSTTAWTTFLEAVEPGCGGLCSARSSASRRRPAAVLTRSRPPESQRRRRCGRSISAAGDIGTTPIVSADDLAASLGGKYELSVCPRPARPRRTPIARRPPTSWRRPEPPIASGTTRSTRPRVPRRGRSPSSPSRTVVGSTFLPGRTAMGEFCLDVFSRTRHEHGSGAPFGPCDPAGDTCDLICVHQDDKNTGRLVPHRARAKKTPTASS